MSQNSLVLPTTGTVSGLQMTGYTNLALDSLNTLNSGAAAPASPEAGQLWHDTFFNQLKIRDLANTTWIAMGALDETNKLFLPAQTRLRLTGNLNLYVATTGSDSNTGFSGSPFLTIQAAINACYNYDLNGFIITINVADGTYTNPVTVNAPFVGASVSGGVILLGDTVSPSSCLLSTSTTCITVTNAASIITVRGFKLTSSAGFCIYAARRGQINMDANMEYGSAAKYHIVADDGSSLYISANYTISGYAQAHYVMNDAGANIVLLSSLTITLTGTPAFSTAFASLTGASALYAEGATFSGSATGTRYNVALNGVIQTGGAGANFFPGNSAGVTSNGGQYV